MLAQDLGMSLAEIRSLSNVEIEEWRAFYAVREQRRQLEEMKRGHRR